MNVVQKISTYYVEDNMGRAEVVNGPENPQIVYYDGSGHKFFIEDYPGKSIAQVEAIAEDWALGYKQLNG